MIKKFKTQEEFNEYSNIALNSGDICFVEDSNKVYFYTNNINGENAVYTTSVSNIVSTDTPKEELFEMLETDSEFRDKPVFFETITYKGRTFTKEVYVMLSLPFDATMQDLTEAFGDTLIIQFPTGNYTIDEANKKVLVEFKEYRATKKEISIKAYTPFMIYPTKTITAEDGITFHNKVIDNSKEDNTFNCLYWDFIPSRNTISFGKGCTYMNGSGGLSTRTSTTPTTLKSWRCLFMFKDEFMDKFDLGWRVSAKYIN